jgi:hypothetical protein
MIATPHKASLSIALRPPCGLPRARARLRRSGFLCHVGTIGRLLSSSTYSLGFRPASDRAKLPGFSRRRVPCEEAPSYIRLGFFSLQPLVLYYGIIRPRRKQQRLRYIGRQRIMEKWDEREEEIDIRTLGIFIHFPRKRAGGQHPG